MGFRVGVVLQPAKAKKHLHPVLLKKAADSGIEIVILSIEEDLAKAGPLNAVLHKIHRNREWQRKLEAYAEQHTDVVVVDHYDAVRQVCNRATMLAPLQGGIACEQRSAEGRKRRVQCCAPAQVVVPLGTTAETIKQAMLEHNVNLPVLAKPMWTDGREGSKDICVVPSANGIYQLLQPAKTPVVGELQLPVMLQQFWEHSGCLYKVYVLGDVACMVTRPSLDMAALATPEPVEGLIPLARISAFDTGQAPEGHEPPPDSVVEWIASFLRRRLRLNLFNFDLIIPVDGPESDGAADYMVVDINYFPGFEKLENYVDLMVGFLLKLCQSQLQDFDAPVALVQGGCDRSDHMTAT